MDIATGEGAAVLVVCQQQRPPYWVKPVSCGKAMQCWEPQVLALWCRSGCGRGWRRWPHGGGARGHQVRPLRAGDSGFSLVTSVSFQQQSNITPAPAIVQGSRAHEHASCPQQPALEDVSLLVPGGMANCRRAHAQQVRLALERISKRERIKLQLAKTHAQLAEVTPLAALAARGPSGVGWPPPASSPTA